MKKRIEDYMKRIDDLLRGSADATNWRDLRKEHLEQISFYQHERLVHLLVTMLVAILLILSIGISLIADCIYMLALSALLLVLLVPYIFHYYFLENSVQRMYQQYDEILSKVIFCRKL